MNGRELGMARDATILALVNRFGCLTTGQICRAVFSGRTAMQSCRRRLKLLTRRGKLHRARINAGGQYVYSAGKIGQVEHRLAVVEVYLKLLRERRQGERVTFEPEYILAGNDRADALITWHMADRTCWAFLEVQRRGRARLSKYVRHYRSGLWTEAVYPRVVVVGDTGKVPTGLTVVGLDGSVRAAMCDARCQSGAKTPA